MNLISVLFGVPQSRGPKGDTGAIGPQGPQGPAGPQGQIGPQGLKGDTGAQGPIGPQGSMGTKGDKGEKGDTGSQGAIGPQGPKGDKGDTGAVGPKGDSVQSKKIKVSFNEINLRSQSKNDYFVVIQDKLADNLSDQYSSYANLEHSFFTETSENDIDYLRMVVVASDDSIVKQLNQKDFADLIKSKRLVPGATFHSLDINMDLNFMKKHLSNSDERIIMLFVGDQREVVNTEVDAVDYLLLKLAKIEQQLMQSNQFDNNRTLPRFYQPGDVLYAENKIDPNS